MNYDRWVIGYHGCDEEVARRLLLGGAFTGGRNRYDWLGSGIQFWEHGLQRAQEWAENQRERGRVKKPTVVGALIRWVAQGSVTVHEGTRGSPQRPGGIGPSGRCLSRNRTEWFELHEQRSSGRRGARPSAERARLVPVSEEKSVAGHEMNAVDPYDGAR